MTAKELAPPCLTWLMVRAFEVGMCFREVLSLTGCVSGKIEPR